ncbi:MAG: hypothetical protein ABI624_10005 [Casimicrobiaceae bacterium]
MIDAVEFYNPSLDHYFVTAFADEIGKLDSGATVGWQRTGQSFKVLEAGDTTPGASSVCRFYGVPAAGLDSHFYSASAVECDAVKLKFPTAWLLESSDVFQVYLPNLTTGVCPSNTLAVYRSWNKRTDSNHRYTTSASIQAAMIAKGYAAEGYGAAGHEVAMCAPMPAGVAPPVCTLGASSATASTGTTVLLSASCTQNPVSYTWSGCTSTTATCVASSPSDGHVTYTVVATNAIGVSAPANVEVTWSAAPPPNPSDPIPVCSLIVSAQDQSPLVNSLVVLESACSSVPTAYVWTNCASLTSVCLARATTSGLQSYSVAATSAGGTGKAATANVNWVDNPVPPQGLCGSFPNALYSDVGNSTVTAHSLFNAPPAFSWNGVWAVRFTVPATAIASDTGLLAVAEYGSPVTHREITLSQTACDFRPTDTKGLDGPLERANGDTTAMTFGIGVQASGLTGLSPGSTYYLNIRNFNPVAGVLTCPSDPGRCDASAYVGLPR